MHFSYISRLGNTYFKKLLNNTMLKNDDGHMFGEDYTESISSVLGKNHRDSLLSPLGNMIVHILDMYDPNHVYNAIQD